MVTEEVKAYSAKVLQIFGHNIQRVRERKQYSFTEIATMSGYGRQYISALELGEKDIQLSTAIKLARGLDVPLAKLFTREPDGDTAVLDGAFTEDNYLLVFNSNVRRRLMATGTKEIHIYMETGMDTATINRILNAKTIDPRISTLAKIAAGVGADLGVLLSRVERGESEG